MLFADVGESVQRGFDEFAVWVPRLVAFLAILIIGYIVAKVVAGLIRKLLDRTEFDRRLHSGTGGTWIARASSRPSHLLATIVFWIIFVGAISIALDALGIQALENFVATVWAYIPNLIAALLIFLIAGALAAGAAALINRTMGETATGRVLQTVVPVLILAVAGFMILDQLQIAEQIVVITYASLMGSAALALALAFGLGGREVAADMLRGAYDDQRDQVKRDFREGRDRARVEAARARARIDGDDVPTAADRDAERRSEDETRAVSGVSGINPPPAR